MRKLLLSVARQVLVTGASRPAGAAVVRLLRAQGVVVVAADSRPVTGDPNALVLPPPDDPSFHWSLSRALEERQIGLLVPTVDEELPIVAEARSRLAAAGCRVFISPSEAIRAANDRWWTYETLRLNGIDVPRSVCGIPRPAAAGLLPFPVVSFPRLRGSDGQVAEHERLEDLPERLSAGRVYCERLPGARYEVHLFAAGGGEAPTLRDLEEERTERAGERGGGRTRRRRSRPHRQSEPSSSKAPPASRSSGIAATARGSSVWRLAPAITSNARRRS